MRGWLWSPATVGIVVGGLLLGFLGGCREKGREEPAPKREASRQPSPMATPATTGTVRLESMPREREAATTKAASAAISAASIATSQVTTALAPAAHSEERPSPQAPVISGETSPYLRTLTTGPVHWRAWHSDTLAYAVATGRPLLLSFGASWSSLSRQLDDVSLADAQVAHLVNELYVPVKIDVDQYPDSVARYGLFASLLRRIRSSTGVPIAFLVLALPDGRPFEAIEWLPPVSTTETLGMKEFLQRAAAVATRETTRAATQALGVERSLEQLLSRLEGGTSAPVDAETVERLARQVSQEADHDAQDLVVEPARSARLAMLLLTQFSETRATASLELAQKVLNDLYRGPLRDPILGGYFHSLSREGLPADGKLLIDQAEVLRAYSLAFAATGKKIYREAAEEVLRFLRDTFERQGGGFFSSQELGPDPLGPTGYFSWSAEEILSILGDTKECQVLLRYYGLDAYAPAQKVFLRPARSLQNVASSIKIGGEAAQAALDAARGKLREARYEREDFPRVNKALIVSWTAAAISAYADAYRYFGDVQARDFALESAAVLLNLAGGGAETATSGGLLAHYGHRDRLETGGFLEDSVAVAAALLDCAEISGKNGLISAAEAIMKRVDEEFVFRGSGLYQDRARSSEAASLGWRLALVPVSDGLVESPNATAAWVWLRLHQLTGEKRYWDRSRQIVARVAAMEEWWGPGLESFARSALLVATPAPKAVIVGDPSRPDTLELWRAALGCFRPGKAVELLTPDEAGKTDYLPAKDGKALGYVCTAEACAPPVRDAKKLRQLIHDFGRR